MLAICPTYLRMVQMGKFESDLTSFASPIIHIDVDRLILSRMSTLANSPPKSLFKNIKRVAQRAAYETVVRNARMAATRDNPAPADVEHLAYLTSPQGVQFMDDQIASKEWIRELDPEANAAQPLTTRACFIKDPFVEASFSRVHGVIRRQWDASANKFKFEILVNQYNANQTKIKNHVLTPEVWHPLSHGDRLIFCVLPTEREMRRHVADEASRGSAIHYPRNINKQDFFIGYVFLDPDDAYKNVVSRTFALFKEIVENRTKIAHLNSIDALPLAPAAESAASAAVIAGPTQELPASSSAVAPVDAVEGVNKDEDESSLNQCSDHYDSEAEQKDGAGPSRKRKRESAEEEEKEQSEQEPNAKISRLSSSDVRMLDKIAEEFTCAICTDLLIHPVVLPCGHAFCKHCIDEWLMAKRTCPSCRYVYTAATHVARSLESALCFVAEKVLSPEQCRKRVELEKLLTEKSLLAKAQTECTKLLLQTIQRLKLF